MHQKDLARKIDLIKNTGETIAQSLKEMIYEGQLKPGEPLKQDHIAAMFGVSRVPVRDALNLLINMRLVVNIPRRGVVVHPLSKSLLEELFEVRRILEGAAIKIVIHKLNSEILDKLNNIIVRQKKALDTADVKGAERLDDRFHRTIYSSTGNETLNELIYANWMRIKHARCSSSMVVPENGRLWIKNSIQRHEDLCAALHSNDETRAYHIVVANIDSSFEEVINCLEEMGWLE
jgi:DNA-binding GntR family transcriptional regulator